MPVTQVGVVHATNSKLLMRVIIPHEDDAEIDRQIINAGETLVKLPFDIYVKGGVEAVREAIGPATFSGRCAVVDEASNVIDHLIADPELYSDPRGQLIPSDLTIYGDSWDGKQFTRPFAELDKTTGKVVGLSIQEIEAAKPEVHPENILMSLHSLDVQPVIGADIPGITEKIAEAAIAIAEIAILG